MEHTLPHLVKMQNKLGKDGLVVITVSVDGLKDEFDKKFDGKAEVLQRLKSKQTGVLTNFLLDESVELWQAKLRFDAVPAAFVFNRDGKYRLFKEGDYDEDAIDRTVLEFLKKK